MEIIFVIGLKTQINLQYKVCFLMLLNKPHVRFVHLHVAKTESNINDLLGYEIMKLFSEKNVHVPVKSRL